MKKILIVEDSNLMISIIKNFVKKKLSDIEFIEAHNGAEAVQKYAENRPDITFMDIKMPEMDGITALEKIHEIDSTANVIMVTSLKEESQEQKAKELGAKLYIMKPFSSDDIFQALDTMEL